ncbi:MAG: MarR family winged helix-turn-helix transcriptional regulator [Acidobacteriota bacterium]
MLERQADQRLRKTASLSFSHFLILLLIEDARGDCQRTMARLLGTTEASVSRYIDFLVTEKLIQRKEDKDNRRQYILTVTSEGKSRLRRALQETETIFATAFKALAADIEQALDKNFTEVLNREQSYTEPGPTYA